MMTPSSALKAESPSALETISRNPRIRIRRSGPPAEDAKCVVYWMQRAERAVDNPALDVAIDVANELDLPIVVFFSAISNFPSANLRHYVFLNQGLRDIEADLAERGISFIVRRPPKNSLEALLTELRAAMVIGDENPCREPERWRSVLAHRLKIPYWTVDADVLVPSGLFPKHYFALHIFRPKLYAHFPTYLVKPENPKPVRQWQRPPNFESFDVKEDLTEGWKHLDRTVQPVDYLTGGTHAALKRLKDFVANDLAHYQDRRNHPEKAGTSHLSPYLHFGHIGPLTIALAVDQALKQKVITKEAYDAFIGEVIGWRELAVNFVKYVPAYDSIDCAEPWAQKTLREHARDKRDPVYTLEQLEKAETYDELWNASQMQMVKFGWMHNYMRMYWAKKILEWSQSPAIAFENAVYLNDRYELDGRDPNGYAGIAWAIAGVHDRPWFDRPIFGTIRYMSAASTGKKFNSKLYIRNVMENEPPPLLT
ncbi:deoxyribodipyrimidine photo-lyase [Acidisarcina polymorpha]|nr:deoxyribodipyrimidine photo-lyase [Acidisarcina polymorpha]